MTLLYLWGEICPGKVFALRTIKSTLIIPRTREELLKITKLPDRTLRYNLSILKKQGLVRETPLLSDLRKKVFSLTVKKGLSPYRIDDGPHSTRINKVLVRKYEKV